MGTCKTTVMLMGRLRSVCACMPMFVQSVFQSLNVCTSTLQRPVKCCLNEVPVQLWWVVFDGHVICLFSPIGLFLLAERGTERVEEKENQEWGRADRFTPSPLLVPPMSHLILLPTAKSTPLTHSELFRTTTADCLLLYLTIWFSAVNSSFLLFFFLQNIYSGIGS